MYVYLSFPFRVMGLHALMDIPWLTVGQAYLLVPAHQHLVTTHKTIYFQYNLTLSYLTDHSHLSFSTSSK